MSKIKVFMVDDHDFVTSMMKGFLEMEGISVVGTESSYEGAAKHALNRNPDVILVDLNIAGQSGIDLIKELKKKNNDCKSIIFSARTALTAITAAYRAGAKGYLTKNNEPSELINAIKTVSSGQTYYMPGYAEKILSYQSDASNIDPREALTKREFELFVLLAQGVIQEDIAKILNIVPKSVVTRASEIRKKLGNSHEDFAIIANKYGISFIRD